MASMTSNKPYLIRGIYEWIVDNHLTPYILVDALAGNVQVPQEYVVDGRIVLNLSPDACRELLLENHEISFTARFSGIATQIFLPIRAVIAIYAKENGRGMEFEIELDDEPPPPRIQPSGPSKPVKTRSKTVLKLVK